MLANQRLYVTADKSAIVLEGDPRAAFLLAATGQPIPKLVDGVEPPEVPAEYLTDEVTVTFDSIEKETSDGSNTDPEGDPVDHVEGDDAGHSEDGDGTITEADGEPELTPAQKRKAERDAQKAAAKS